MNLVLAIDTATPAVTAGVVRRGPSGEQVLGERVTVDPRAHAEQLTPNVLGALSDAGLGMGDLTVVVVGCGPGPFTGLRVGMATAAAYGHALGLPVFGVCSLDAIGVDTSGDVLVVTDARRREVYWARYRDGVRVGGPAVNAPADVPTNVSAVAGSPDHAMLFGLPCLAPVQPTASGLVRVVDWAAVGPGVPPLAGEGEATEGEGWPEPLIPLYLRRPDAKPQQQPVRP
jgi:tRNA threonylcarbamoyl adenosine modification protein YeaZ